MYRYIVEQALEDAVESELFICGMQPVSEESPCHGIYQCDPDLVYVRNARGDGFLHH